MIWANILTLKGKVTYSEVLKFYQDCDVLVNPSNTGSLDKTVLEAMSCGRIVITCNEAYYNVFNEKLRERCYFNSNDYKDLAEKIKFNLHNPDNDLEKELRDIVVKHHSLEHWVDELLGIFEEAEK